MNHIRMCLSAAVLVLWGCTEAPASELACGAGTTSSAGKCVPALETLCGEGTVAQAGRCVAAQAQVTCGRGTVLEGSTCVSTASSITCGAGTVQQGSECVPFSTLSCGAGTVQQGSECVPSSTLSCGAGTVRQGSECVPSSTLSCGTGTARAGDVCQADLSKVCGTDTTGSNNGTSCVSVVSCGSGTSRNGNVCSVSSSACGTGTTLSGGRCEVSPGSVCGAGTVWENGQCVKPVQSPTLEAFTGHAALAKSFYKNKSIGVGGGYQYEYRAVVTDLSQGSADGWVQSGAALVGDGAAVHVTFHGLATLSTGSSFEEKIRSALVDGVCNTSLTPTSTQSGSGETYANFFAWSSTVSSMRVCALGGSVKVGRLTVGGVDTARLTFNVQFSDGTVWQDKVFDMPWREKV